MSRKIIGSPLDRVNRNNHNENYEELYNVLSAYLESGKLTDEQYAETLIIVKGLVKKGELSVNDINKNLGKLDQTYMSDDFLQQITGNAKVNMTPADNSITIEKMDSILKGYLTDARFVGKRLDDLFIEEGAEWIENLYSSDLVRQGGVSGAGTSDSLNRIYLKVPVAVNRNYRVYINSQSDIIIRNIFIDKEGTYHPVKRDGIYEDESFKTIDSNQDIFLYVSFAYRSLTKPITPQDLMFDEVVITKVEGGN